MAVWLVHLSTQRLEDQWRPISGVINTQADRGTIPELHGGNGQVPRYDSGSFSVFRRGWRTEWRRRSRRRLSAGQIARVEKVPKHGDIAHGRRGMMGSFVALDHVAENVEIVAGVSVELVSIQKLVQASSRPHQFLIGFDHSKREAADQLEIGFARGASRPGVPCLGAGHCTGRPRWLWW